METRAYNFEIRAEKNEKGVGVIVGRPIVYESKTDLGWFSEVIARGALDKTDLKDVKFLVNHDTSKIPLARSRNNNENSTMQLSVDDDGMKIRVNLDVENNTEAKNLYSAIDRGDITGMLPTLRKNYPDADLVAIPPLKNIWDNKQYSTTYSEGGLIAFCPKTADEETVEACVTYLDWMCTKEGGFTLYHGFEGEHFEYDEDGVPVVIDPDYNTADKDWIRGDLFLTGNAGYFETVDDFNKATAKQYPGYEDHFIADQEYALVGDHIEDIDDSLYTSPSQAKLAADINLVRDEWLVKVITCPEAEFEANWDSFMAALKDAGVETVNEERTAYFSNK